MVAVLSNLLRFILVLALALVVAVLLVLGFIFKGGPSFTYRYRLTIEVDTPQGLKSGSSVIETTLTNNHGIKWLPYEARLFIARTRGEAVFVDLGERRNIIALLGAGLTGKDDPNFRMIVPGSLGIRWDTPRETISAIEAAVARRAKLDVPANHIPTLMTFHNLDDPGSAEVVPANEPLRVFGPGYGAPRAKIEMLPTGWWPANSLGLSGVPLTSKIEEKIPTILKIVGEKDKKLTIEYAGAPYEARSGQFKRRQ